MTETMLDILRRDRIIVAAALAALTALAWTYVLSVGPTPNCERLLLGAERYLPSICLMTIPGANSSFI